MSLKGSIKDPIVKEFFGTNDIGEITIPINNMNTLSIDMMSKIRKKSVSFNNGSDVKISRMSKSSL